MTSASWIPLADGEYLDGYIEIEEGRLSVKDVDDHGTYWAGVDLPAKICLCQLVDVDVDTPQPMDAPDSAGWWAFEGRYATEYTPFRAVWGVESIKGQLQACTQDGRSRIPVEWLVGKWTRVYMPWEVQDAI